ncbi:iron-containing redox enzyme family protein [Pseudomonas guariconensis]|uniref:iron-containing redox enzyme family protein n=1 Tax=Pseudomonas guariconensis TaxID=1288410 RepID=UPI0018A9D810|nr:iron-containing redox enzyme family protein [Pseudomonas guariconensis]MBF8743016.1 iron-containing redox enzyme family protein [Pseudomonas guariconensis]MBF8752457.1 iron-containing redox enzyme family protein [Pseudomonas guariconensis]
MTVMTRKAAPVAPALAANDSLERRYQALLQGRCEDSALWLAEQLDRADTLPDDLPTSAAQLDDWSARHAAKVARDHAAYLQARRQGAPRRYFANRAQALWFLQQVAPTKAVDGAWLQGLLHQWPDPRYHGLIRTYLEELGDGDPRCNHVLIYQRLLSRLGCLEPLPLAPERYLQGAVQLALGQNTEAFLPEVIGYNLGYEQPPLHLLISTHELAELGIDGHYFQLHVTIDNAASGHAHKAIQALRQLWPAEDGEGFYQRVRRGYRLNDLGTDTPSLIASFDLEGELLAALERKRAFGQMMHSDHCRLQGRSINEWLSEADAMPGFLKALQGQGWVRRGEDPARSRLWKLIEGPAAAMFGVFSAYEKQLWHDWIANGWEAPRQPRVAPGSWQLDVEPDDTGIERTPVSVLIERMAGNGHALPQGLRATRAYIQATGLAQEESR